MLIRPLLPLLATVILVSYSSAGKIRVKRQNMKVRINATADTIILKFIRPNPDIKLEGYILGYGSSMHSKQFIKLPDNGEPYVIEIDAEPKYLVAVQPVPSNDVKKQCKESYFLEKPLHLVVGSITSTSVLLSWGGLVKTSYEGSIQKDCLEDGNFTVRFKEMNRRWNYQMCPTSDTVIDNLKPDTPYAFSVRTNQDKRKVWSKIVIHNTNMDDKAKQKPIVPKATNTKLVKPFMPGPHVRQPPPTSIRNSTRHKVFPVPKRPRPAAPRPSFAPPKRRPEMPPVVKQRATQSPLLPLGKTIPKKTTTSLPHVPHRVAITVPTQKPTSDRVSSPSTSYGVRPHLSSPRVPDSSHTSTQDTHGEHHKGFKIPKPVTIPMGSPAQPSSRPVKKHINMGGKHTGKDVANVTKPHFLSEGQANEMKAKNTLKPRLLPVTVTPIKREPQLTTTATPTLKGQTTTPTLKVQKTTPTLEGQTTTPTWKARKTTATLKGRTTTPTPKGRTTTPTPKGRTTTPTPKGRTTTPTPKGRTTTPTPKGRTTTPTPKGRTTTPTWKRQTTTPTLKGETVTPTLDDETATPTLDDETATPTLDDETAMPTLDDQTTTPTLGDETATPTLDDETATPTLDDETATPTLDDETATPTLDDETATLDDETAAPTLDDETATPTLDDETATPTLDDETATLDDETATPTLDDETATPTLDDETATLDDETATPILNGSRFDLWGNSSMFRPAPSSDLDAMGNRRYTAPHVVYKTGKTIEEPCSITDSLKYFPEEEGGDQNVTGPPRLPPSNLTVVTVEGCPSFIILDWEKGDNETTDYEVTATARSPNGKKVSIVNTNQTHTALENLKPKSSYEFSVIPRNELADPRVTENTSGKAALWSQFSFEPDGFSECNGRQYVKRTWYRKFVGIQLCNSLRYKIYLSDTLRGTFYHIGDQTGYGEDHCQFVDSFLDGRTGNHLLSQQLPSRPGFYRAMRQEPVSFGEIGGHTHITYVPWYECGTPIPGKW
ncbi:hypothetical protein SKAU_G00258990 [Synaphobranchus kaupii]|uniref:Fibronectin type-III domain-containing protein n=1 Tax=Synaphobranchus kaupii TaxID=118154 RepID=A0A9Q1F4H8_SYNKA|nr:hypothetical protein SKAU_G00258990 [Synaphobranchus kaupii]